MTLTELRYIVAVAKEKQFGKAAKSCFVSQPTLSLGIKKLEDELGVILFERRPQELVVTPIGLKIIKQAEQALKEVNAIKELASLQHDPLIDPLRLGAIHTVGPYLYPSLLQVVHDVAPKLPLFIEESYTSQLTQKLKRGEIDVAVISLPYDEAGLETLVLYEEPFVILVPSSHPLAMNETITIKELAKETVLLLGPEHCFRDQVLELCPECFHHESDTEQSLNKFEGSSLETIRFMVAGGVGVTIVPRTAACADKYAQRLIAIKHFSNMNPTRKIALAWRKNFTRPKAIDVIAECIRKCQLGGVKIINNQTSKLSDYIKPKKLHNQYAV